MRCLNCKHHMVIEMDKTTSDMFKIIVRRFCLITSDICYEAIGKDVEITHCNKHEAK